MLRLCFYDSEGKRSAARFLPVSAALVPVDDDGYMVHTDRIVTVHSLRGGTRRWTNSAAARPAS